MPHPLPSGPEQRPIATVDIVIVTLSEGALRLGLQRRDREPHKGELALIGGYVRPEEDGDIEASARRILADKGRLTGLYLEQLRSFGGPSRDPRGWSISIAYLALVPEATLRAAETRGAPPFELIDPDRCPRLPFDHGRIIAAALQRLRSKASYSTLPAFLLGSQFTLPELKSVYETVMGTPLNDSAFRRKLMEMHILEEVEAKAAATAERKRPAQLYRLAKETLTEFDRTV
ncbi:NUDIX hydrolase [Labrys miyagiensis]|uniref:NUDIX hydrolase n=1 Tax=Labrys miyagiensis TaxID=346912 RepID=A0ABQ6CTS0_9HYPH|nr:NUDIX hydrolase [Labrys miyagiensis]GLS23198.1 NUDIX hydrolase [Labrys miyagiensis]